MTDDQIQARLEQLVSEGWALEFWRLKNPDGSFIILGIPPDQVHKKKQLLPTVLLTEGTEVDLP